MTFNVFSVATTYLWALARKWLKNIFGHTIYMSITGGNYGKIEICRPGTYVRDILVTAKWRVQAQMYNQLIGQMIARDETEAAELKQHMKNIQFDLDRSESCQQQLSHVKEKLRLYNIYEGGLYVI